MSWNNFSWKGLTGAAAVAAMVTPVLAAPNVVATADPTFAAGNYTWSIGVDPDDALYGPNPGGGAVGGSVAIEWTLSSTGLSAAAKNATNFPNDNPGNSGPDGLSPVAAGAVTANLGSTFLTGAGTFQAVTLTVPGPAVAVTTLGNNHVSTVNVGGVYSAVGPPLVVGGTQALIAQDGVNALMTAGTNFRYQVFGGDANFSGDTNAGAPYVSVTASDVQLLAPNLNQAGLFRWNQGDFNGTGTVTAADVQILAANLNKDVSAFLVAGALTPPAALGGIGGSSVPEPGSVVLAGLASIGLIVAARRNKK